MHELPVIEVKSFPLDPGGKGIDLCGCFYAVDFDGEVIELGQKSGDPLCCIGVIP